MDNTEKYKDWDILESLPENWIIDKTAGSPLSGTVFITNGKSVLNNQKRALLKVPKKNHSLKEKIIKVDKVEEKQEYKKDTSFIFPAKEINTLAQKQMQERLLKDILFDLNVCDLEGWDKKEYLNEIKGLLNE